MSDPWATPPEGEQPTGEPAGRPAGPPGPPASEQPYGQPPSGQAPYGQAPYGQAPQGYPPPGYPGYPPQGPGNNGMAIASLVLGIVGFCCGQLFVLSIGAIVTGFIGRNQINQSGGQLKGGGLALAGMILGILGILVGILYWILAANGFLDSDLFLNTN